MLEEEIYKHLSCARE